MFTIKHAARAVGVSEATLRAWERRYGIGSPLRSASGYRLYDDAAVRALETMKHLVDEGWPVKTAAEETLRRLAHEEDAADAQRLTLIEGHDLDALVPLAQGYDVSGLDDLLDERFASASFESVVDDWLLPALSRLGAAWEAGEVSVAGEHLVSHGVARRLSVAYEAAGDAPFGAQVVIGLPPGARHDLGLLCFATAARRVGLAPRYLGTDVPTKDWIRAISPAGVRAVVLSAPLREDLPALQAVVDAVRLTRPDVLVAVGGAHQNDVPTYCMRLGHRIGDAAQELAVRLT